MPIYEYRCNECGENFEKLQKNGDEPLTICEKCGGKLEKQWSLSGFQFKGDGWYVTDYAKKSGPNSDSSSEPLSKKESTDSKETASNNEAKPKKEEKTKTDTTKTEKS